MMGDSRFKVCACTHMCVCMYVCMCLFVSLCVCMCVCAAHPKSKEVVAIALEFLGNGQKLELRPLRGQAALLLVEVHQRLLKVNRLGEEGDLLVTSYPLAPC